MCVCVRWIFVCISKCLAVQLCVHVWVCARVGVSVSDPLMHLAGCPQRKGHRCGHGRGRGGPRQLRSYLIYLK